MIKIEYYIVRIVCHIIIIVSAFKFHIPNFLFKSTKSHFDTLTFFGSKLDLHAFQCTELSLTTTVNL